METKTPPKALTDDETEVIVLVLREYADVMDTKAWEQAFIDNDPQLRFGAVPSARSNTLRRLADRLER